MEILQNLADLFVQTFGTYTQLETLAAALGAMYNIQTLAKSGASYLSTYKGAVLVSLAVFLVLLAVVVFWACFSFPLVYAGLIIGELVYILEK